MTADKHTSPEFVIERPEALERGRATEEYETIKAKFIAAAVRDATVPNTRKAYQNSLTAFFDWFFPFWCDGEVLDRDTVIRYKEACLAQGLSPSTINQRLSALRRAVREVADDMDATGVGNGMTRLADRIGRVKDVRSHGTRLGTWLTKNQVEALIKLPNTNKLIGLRDRAVLSLLISCALRREEVCSITYSHIQLVEERWVIKDLQGKGNRIRTVGMETWAKQAVDRWAEAANIPPDGPLFFSIRKGFRQKVKFDRPLTGKAVYEILGRYEKELGVGFAPHDLRRTSAKLMFKGKADMRDIQQTLGHSSIATTERYLGTEQRLDKMPCDFMDLKVEGEG